MLGQTASDSKAKSSIGSGNEDTTVGKIEKSHDGNAVLGYKFYVVRLRSGWQTRGTFGSATRLAEAQSEGNGLEPTI